MGRDGFEPPLQYLLAPALANDLLIVSSELPALILKCTGVGLNHPAKSFDRILHGVTYLLPMPTAVYVAVPYSKMGGEGIEPLS